MAFLLHPVFTTVKNKNRKTTPSLLIEKIPLFLDMPLYYEERARKHNREKKWQSEKNTASQKGG
jgi:hypothetical protein